MSTPKTIVLVDDEQDFHTISKIKFYEEIKSGTLNIHCFCKPTEALEYIKKNGEHINIVFTDLKMGKLDGFELISEIQKHYPSLPCYIISAFSSDMTRSRAEKLNVAGYMQKPIDYGTIKDIIEEI